MGSWQGTKSEPNIYGLLDEKMVIGNGIEPEFRFRTLGLGLIFLLIKTTLSGYSTFKPVFTTLRKDSFATKGQPPSVIIIVLTGIKSRVRNQNRDLSGSRSLLYPSGIRDSTLIPLSHPDKDFTRFAFPCSC